MPRSHEDRAALEQNPRPPQFGLAGTSDRTICRTLSAMSPRPDRGSFVLGAILPQAPANDLARDKPSATAPISDWGGLIHVPREIEIKSDTHASEVSTVPHTMPTCEAGARTRRARCIAALKSSHLEITRLCRRNPNLKDGVRSRNTVRGRTVGAYSGLKLLGYPGQC